MNLDINSWYSDSQKIKFLESHSYYVERVSGIKTDIFDCDYPYSMTVAVSINDDIPEDIDKNPYLDNEWYRNHELNLVFRRVFLDKLIELLSK